MFVQPVTTWSISAKDPAGGPLTYVWQLTPDAPNEACGTPHAPWTQKGAQASWSHSNEAPDYCMHLTTDHVVTVTVTVTNQQGISVTCMIKGTESEDVPNPPCK